MAPRDHYAHSHPDRPEADWHRLEDHPTEESQFSAHSQNGQGRVDPLREHLVRVAELAGEYAAAFGAVDEARMAGLLHDLGKYGTRFQDRLRGEAHGIDHWSTGAWAALQQYHRSGIGSALAIHGHHVGLQQAAKAFLKSLEPQRLAAHHPQQLTLSETDHAQLLERLSADGVELPGLDGSVYEIGSAERAASMLDVRMLFSALVDADFIDTEAHFDAQPGTIRTYRASGPELKPEAALALLDEHIDGLARGTDASDSMRAVRLELLKACRSGAAGPQRPFTLSAPTGAGKTVAMLAFALAHAKAHGLRRVIVVIPYVSIIEQTASIYRGIFEPHFGPNYVIEHHSLAGAARKESQGSRVDMESDDPAVRMPRLLAENWDAPVVVTTSVQFFESLLSNRPSACRKLHRVAKSVVLFDEAQTLPRELAVPTLATLSRLVERYGSTVVFATATQPAFDHLHRPIQKWAGLGWQPREIAGPELKLFYRSKRTQVLWPETDSRIVWSDLAGELARPDNRCVLCIVNLKRHALELVSELSERNADGLCHLSTNMCPAHRQRALQTVRERLASGESCRLISTQCVEAGVDVDFPVVYRAFGPLDAIAQAAGRCNREGKNPKFGEVRVFVPEDERYPPGGYGQAAEITDVLLRERRASGRPMDIDDTGLFREYYQMLYQLAQVGDMAAGRAKTLREAIEIQDFRQVAHLYRLIPRDAVDVLVPYNRDRYEELANEVRREGLSADWTRRARPHTISLYRTAPHEAELEPVPVARGEVSGDWFFYLNEAGYDAELLGLVSPVTSSAWIA